MNEITRKAANALVATVDFFSGALAEEARAGEEKQRQLDALAGQLKTGANSLQDAKNVLEDSEAELARAKDEIETLRLRVSVLEAREKGVEDLRRERDDLLLKCKNLRAITSPISLDEARKILIVLQHVKRLTTIFPRNAKGALKPFLEIVDDLDQAMKDLDDIKLDP